ncbi:unnamed protein product [Brassica rapa subsp. trilocularis]
MIMHDSNWMDYLWFERMQPEFNSSRRFDDDEDNPMVLNQSTESNQSDNVSQSIFSVWDMGCPLSVEQKWILRT